jgi:hypothetical protein
MNLRLRSVRSHVTGSATPNFVTFLSVSWLPTDTVALLVRKRLESGLGELFHLIGWAILAPEHTFPNFSNMTSTRLVDRFLHQNFLRRVRVESYKYGYNYLWSLLSTARHSPLGFSLKYITVVRVVQGQSLSNPFRTLFPEIAQHLPNIIF